MANVYRLACAVSAFCFPVACAAAPKERAFSFEAREIASDVEGAYLTSIADLNGDARADVILLSVRSREVAWYENPNWCRHLLARDVAPAAVGAAVDTSGAAARIVLLTGFNRESFEKNAGELVYLSQADGGEPAVFAREPAAHRAVFADVNGDGAKELVVAPIAGETNDPPLRSLDPTPLFLFSPPASEKRVITDSLEGTVHGLTAIDWDNDGREDILTAGLGGVWLHRADVQGGDPLALSWTSEHLSAGRPDEDPRKRGAGDIRVGAFADGRRFLATIETVHGNEAAVYVPGPDGGWRRRVIGEGYALLHGFALGDLNGDGADDIVVSDSRGDGGVYVYYSPDGKGKEWRTVTLDRDGMAAGACDAVDMTGDGRLDVVCAGFQTSNAKLYVNRAHD